MLSEDSAGIQPLASDPAPVVRETLAEKLGTVPPAAPVKNEGSVFYQFVIFPLVVVVVAVAIFGFFRWAGEEDKTYDKYLEEISSSWSQRRAEAAYQLIVRVADPEDSIRKTADVSRTLAVFEAAKADETKDADTAKEAARVRRYLAVVLGYLADPRAVPDLLDAAGPGEADTETRLNSAIALGRCHDSRGAATLISLLEDPFEGIRLAAAHALGELNDKSACDALAKRLGTPGEEVDVRWNAALSLARLGDERAVPTLLAMLDRKFLESIQGKRDAEHTAMTDKQRQEVMINALRGIYLLKATSALERVSALADGDPDLLVRQRAMEVRDHLKTLAATPATPPSH